MTKEDLIPIKNHERAVELGQKGGLARSKGYALAMELTKRLSYLANIDPYFKEMLALVLTDSPKEAHRFVRENFKTLLSLALQEGNARKRFEMLDTFQKRYLEYLRLVEGDIHHNYVTDNIEAFNERLTLWKQVREGVYQSTKVERNPNTPYTPNNQQQPRESIKEKDKEIPMEQENNVSEVTTITQEWDEVEPDTEDEEEAVFTIV